MSAIDELAALVVAKARAEGVTLVDAIAFTAVEIGNVISAEIEKRRQVDRAELTGLLSLTEAGLAQANGEIERLKSK